MKLQRSFNLIMLGFKISVLCYCNNLLELLFENILKYYKKVKIKLGEICLVLTSGLTNRYERQIIFLSNLFPSKC
jgi:hypothetical protein